MTETGKVLWITALLWLSTADLLYMKLPYPALFLFALSGILRMAPNFLNAFAQPDGMIIMTILQLLIIGAFSIYVCRKKQMGKGDLIVLMIMGAVCPTEKLLLILSLGFLLAGMASLLIIWTRQGERLPLVPFLGIGCLFAEIVG